MMGDYDHGDDPGQRAKVDTVHDSAYRAGVKAGWNMGVAGDEARFKAAVNARAALEKD